jgi:hypothetical protein
MVVDYYTMHWSDFIGLSGMLLLVSTFFLLQTDRIDPKGFYYSFFNLLVAVFLGINLYYKPVLANIVLEIFWATMSCWGMYKWYKANK